MILKASGRLGVPQGGVISPMLSNVYLNDVDTMLERAKTITRVERWTYVEYARFADDLVVLVDGHPRQRWLRAAGERRLREELATLQVEVNEEKTRRVDLTQGERFGVLGFDFRRIRSRRDRWMPVIRKYYIRPFIRAVHTFHRATGTAAEPGRLLWPCRTVSLPWSAPSAASCVTSSP